MPLKCISSRGGPGESRWRAISIVPTRRRILCDGVCGIPQNQTLSPYHLKCV